MPQQLNPYLEARGVARAAFLVRVILSFVLFAFVEPGLLAPDELTYDRRAELLCQYWHGEILTNPMDVVSRREPVGFVYIVAALYFPFGKSLLLGKLLNAWIGSRAVMELFRVARLVGGSDQAALRAARFLAFFPSQILWSSVVVRDPWVQWILLMLARQVAELKGRFLPSRIVGIVFSVWALTQFRSYLLYAVVGPLVLSFLFGSSRDALRNIVVGTVLVMGAVWFDANRSSTEEKVQSFDLVELQRLRQWSSNENVAESAFGSDADISTVGGALSFLPVGLTYFFFAPFPWQAGSVRQALAIPETLYFYLLVPGVIGGFLYLVRKRFAESIGVVLMTLTVTFGYAIGQGNVGTLYRHKAQVFGFYYAFAALGKELQKQRTLKRDPAVVPTSRFALERGLPS